jgi:portal protein
MPQDDFTQARERYKDAREAMRENRMRMEEDLEFSNPADPKQWERQSITDRQGRPTLTLDNTNQFIQQVVNDGRRNTPSIQTIPENSGANVLVSQQLNGRLRHIEYASRAGIAYDTSLEYSARIGLGWIKVAPKVLDGQKNYQEPRIYGCDDPLAACIDGDSVEFDGSDAMYGFYETVMSPAAFKRRWPKAKQAAFESDEDNRQIGWFTEEGIRVCEYWRVLTSQVNMIEIAGPDGGVYSVTEDEYWEDAQKTGVKPEPQGTYSATQRQVKHYTMSGVDFLEETDFPSKWIGLIPVYGHVLRIKGKRYVCGLTRRLRDGQRFHNYQMSSLAESLLSQPKAPFMAPGRSIEGYEAHWEAMNSGNPAYVPYNDIDDEGNPIGPPIRLAPPQFPVAYGQAANLGLNEMQAAVGMYKSTLGQQSNAVSGRAKQADKVEGDNATFNFHDNLRRSLEQVGRVVVDMDIRLNDTARDVRILSLNADKSSFVRLDPEMQEPVKQDAKGNVVAFNPGIGEYGIIVKTGPSYATQREELEDRLTQLGQGNPQLAAALAPLLVKMADMPEADKVARICLSLLPPPVQQAYDDGDEESNIPPQIKQQMTSMQQSLQQASQMIQKLAAELNQANDENAEQSQQAQVEALQKQRELDIKEQQAVTQQYAAETARMTALAAIQPPDAVQQIEALSARQQEVDAMLAQLAQAHMQVQGQLAAMTDAHADLHDQVMPAEVSPEQTNQTSEVPQPAAPEAAT